MAAAAQTLPDRATPVAPALTSALVPLTQSLLHSELVVRANDPEGVHQFRVAARSLRSVLKAMKPLLDEQWVADVRPQLGEAADAMGRLRDLQVQRDLLLELAGHLPEPTTTEVSTLIANRLSDLIATEQASAMARLNDPRHRVLLATLVAAAKSPPLSSTGEKATVADMVELAADVTAEFDEAASHLSMDRPDPAWHTARIRAKLARYTIEGLEPVLGGDARRWAKLLEGATDSLGEIHDLHVARLTLAELAGRPQVSGLVGYRLGLMDALAAHRSNHDKHHFVTHWPEAHRKMHRHPLQ